MLNECSSKVGQTGETIVAGRPVRTAELSDSFLVRHLAGVASLAAAEGDVRMAKHLVDVAYHVMAED